MSVEDPILEVFFKEYERLKLEQIQRIGFRDNLLYVTLIAFGGVLSFAFSGPSHANALLVIPWVCIILGWTYVVNDEKISSIGKYIRSGLAEKVRARVQWHEEDPLFGWEVAHRSDHARVRRKVQQWFVDELTFVVSGYIALFAFFASSPTTTLLKALCAVEGVLLLVLAIEIYRYADFAKGR